MAAAVMEGLSSPQETSDTSHQKREIRHKTSLVSSLLSLVFLLLAGCGTQPTPQPTLELIDALEPVAGNILANPGFELDEDGDGLPDGWTPNNWGASAQVQTLVSEGAFSGQRAVRIEKLNQAGAASFYQRVPLVPGQPYRVRFFARGQGGRFLLAYLGADGRRLAGENEVDISVEIPPSDGWQGYALTFTPPDRAVSAFLWLAVYGEGNVVTYDDAALTR